MKKCSERCKELGVSCPVTDCSLWIDYESDLNCTLIAIKDHEKGKMTLDETSKRLGISIVRTKQIQDKAIAKLKKNFEKF